MATAAKKTALDPRDFLAVDALLDDEERAIRDTVRQFVRDRVLPDVGEWFEQGILPRELVQELAPLGLFGMHLDGYGLPGASAVAYGLTCMELEAGDSGVRSLVSVQGSLAMFAIWRWGSEEQKQRWLPAMHAGEAIGCFGLTEPDAGSDPGSMRTHARRDGSDWVLNGAKMWITNGTIADVAIVWARTDEGAINGFLVEKGMPGFEAPEMHRKLSLRASVTSELVLHNVRVPEESRFPEVSSLRGPLSCLNEARYGIVWGSVGAGRACLEAALDYAKERPPFPKPSPRAPAPPPKLGVEFAAVGVVHGPASQGREDRDAHVLGGGVREGVCACLALGNPDDLAGLEDAFARGRAQRRPPGDHDEPLLVAEVIVVGPYAL